MTVALTMLLIISPVITAFSPPLTAMVLSVGFTSASATASENGGDEESNTDARTTAGDGVEEEEEDDGDGDDEQQQGEDNSNQQQQDVQGEDEEEMEEQQFANVMGGGGQEAMTGTITPSPGVEICDDFEDNDGDSLIDLADPDCGAAAGPLTQGTVTAPTTPAPTPSATNTTATNSTSNTLTSGLIGLPSLPATTPPQPPPPTDTSSQGGQQGQGQVQEPSPQQGQLPDTTSPGGPTTTRNPYGGTAYTFPGDISITKHRDWGHANIPDKGVSITFDSGGSVGLVDFPDGQLSRGSDNGVTAVFRGMDPLFSHSIQLRPDGTGVLILVDGTEITGKGSTLTITEPVFVLDPNTGLATGGSSITTTYSPDGNVATRNPDGSTTNAKRGSVIGETTTFPDDRISITKGPDGRVYTEIHDKGVIIGSGSGSSGSVDRVDFPDGQLSRGSDNGATAVFPNRDSLTILPDGTAKVELKGDDDTVITSKDYTLTITEPVIDPNTGVKTGESITTYTPPP